MDSPAAKALSAPPRASPKIEKVKLGVQTYDVAFANTKSIPDVRPRLSPHRRRTNRLVLRAQKLENQEDVPTRFFLLRRERGVSKVTWADTFAAVEPNAILDQYDKMLAEDWRLQDLENRVAERGAGG